MLSLELIIPYFWGKTFWNILLSTPWIMRFRVWLLWIGAVPNLCAHLALFLAIISDGTSPVLSSLLTHRCWVLKGTLYRCLGSSSMQLPPVMFCLWALASLASPGLSKYLLSPESSQTQPGIPFLESARPTLSCLPGVPVLCSQVQYLETLFHLLFLHLLLCSYFKQGIISSWLEVEVSKNEFSKHSKFGKG